MNEPKRRGRPPKAKPCAECGQVEGHYDDCPAGLGVVAPSPAQAYADRVWCGQSVSADRAWRVERVRAALEGQGLPFEGVVLP